MGFFMASAIRYHEGDIPAADAARYTGAIAIDTETLGLIPRRDRLCVVQLSPGDGSADVVQIAQGQRSAPNLATLLADPSITKIFHYGRFDIAVLFQSFGVMAQPVFCTKIASRLTRTYTDRHGLKDICAELLNVNLSKQQQSSDWAAETLTPEQLEYAASDVLYLHGLREASDPFDARAQDLRIRHAGGQARGHRSGIHDARQRQLQQAAVAVPALRADARGDRGLLGGEAESGRCIHLSLSLRPPHPRPAWPAPCR